MPSFDPAYHYGDPQQHVPATTGGRAPLVRRIATDKPYVFITIDDGDIKDPHAFDLIRRSGLRPTLFLNHRYFHGHEDYFRRIQSLGSLIEDHTPDHPNLKGKPYAFQRKEICDGADTVATAFGVRPTLLRPPYGNYDDTTLRAAADCGLSAVVTWTAAVNDGVVQFQAGNRLQRGDIVLMHFRTTFVQDYTAFCRRAKQDGLIPVPLPDFLST